MPLTAAEKQRRHRVRKFAEIDAMPQIACACGCGTTIPPINRNMKPARFAHGHNEGGEATRFTGDVSGAEHPNWIGGRIDDGCGYVRVRVGTAHPMAHASGYAYEHRLVMAAAVGRVLEDKEVVHHINENRADNRIENLMLFENKAAHVRHHAQLRKGGD